MRDPWEVQINDLRHVIWGTQHYTKRTYINERLDKKEGVLVEEQDWEDIRGLLTDYLHLLEGEEAA